MATGSDMHGEEYTTGWQKVFTASLRVLGAALIAAFTAIVTNYLVRAQLGGALEVRRLPEGGHVILCGLGSIGFRVVEELLGLNQRVVVIERAGDNALVSTCRRLGAPVLLGDATVREVLRQAHSPSARAVVAATTNDLANLEIALLARELNPKLRVVLCLTDADLARSLREAADIRLSLSVPGLVAPAYVAALFGDRVQSVILVEGRLLATVDLLLQLPRDSFLAGQTVRAVAVDYQMVPLAAITPDGTLHPDLLNARLEMGWRLVAILALPNLERLFNRRPVAQDWTVKVTGFPLPARPWVTQLLRMHRDVSADDAEKMLDTLPCMLASGLSRGQAEDLLALLQRERVTGDLQK
jgi:Trk K+ transport system NAD-binding subunit